MLVAARQGCNFSSCGTKGEVTKEVLPVLGLVSRIAIEQHRACR